VLLHGIAAALLWLVLRRLAVPAACLAATPFAAHPVCVESVAWITERRTVLSTALYLAAFLAYLAWAGAGAAGEPPRSGAGCYALAFALVVAAVLAKRRR
jgi:hypothetical protein